MAAREQKKPNEVLRQQRRLRGWSLQEAVHQLQLLFPDDVAALSPDMISKWELGKYTPSPFYQAKLCKLYDMTAAQLGFMEEPLSPSTSSPLLLSSAGGPVSPSAPAMNEVHTELLERFNRALKRSTTIDECFLSYLEMRTEGYWQDRHRAIVASRDLLGYVLEHFQKVVVLLESSHQPSIRTRLCCIASGVAQLAGHLLFDMNEYRKARNFHHAAITAATEADNIALQAVAWGRISFTWTYSGNPQEALLCIQRARDLATKSVTATVQAYLAAVEGEIQAILNNREACFKALGDAALIEDRQQQQENMYWLHFDCSRLAGYQGICYQRLYYPDDSQTRSFLIESQKALNVALAKLDHSQIQRKSTLLVDLANTYAQQGEVGEACRYALEAIDIASRTQSCATMKRLLTLRYRLDAWKDSRLVGNLDEGMASLLRFTAYRGSHD